MSDTKNNPVVPYELLNALNIIRLTPEIAANESFPLDDVDLVAWRHRESKTWQLGLDFTASPEKESQFLSYPEVGIEEFFYVDWFVGDESIQQILDRWGWSFDTEKQGWHVSPGPRGRNDLELGVEWYSQGELSGFGPITDNTGVIQASGFYIEHLTCATMCCGPSAGPFETQDKALAWYDENAKRIIDQTRHQRMPFFQRFRRKMVLFMTGLFK